MRRTKEKRALVANRQLPKVLVFALDSEQPKKKFSALRAPEEFGFPKNCPKKSVFCGACGGAGFI